MGCDIHFVVERKLENGQWLGVYATDYMSYEMTPLAKKRNYNFFAEIAGVRGEGDREPKGLPVDASLLTDICANEWDGDGHSHSWLTIEEFVDAYITAEKKSAEWYKNAYDEGFVKNANDLMYLNIINVYKESWIKLTENVKNYTRYESSGAYQILGIDASYRKGDYRVVFWFDN